MVVGLKNYRKNKHGAMLIWNPRVVNASMISLKKSIESTSQIANIVREDSFP